MFTDLAGISSKILWSPRGNAHVNSIGYLPVLEASVRLPAFCEIHLRWIMRMIIPAGSLSSLTQWGLRMN